MRFAGASLWELDVHAGAQRRLGSGRSALVLVMIGLLSGVSSAWSNDRSRYAAGNEWSREGEYPPLQQDRRRMRSDNLWREGAVVPETEARERRRNPWASEDGRYRAKPGERGAPPSNRSLRPYGSRSPEAQDPRFRPLSPSELGRSDPAAPQRRHYGSDPSALPPTLPYGHTPYGSTPGWGPNDGWNPSPWMPYTGY